MTGYCFTSGEELIAICKKDGLTISEVMLRRQQELSDDTAENILRSLKQRCTRNGALRKG